MQPQRHRYSICKSAVRFCSYTVVVRVRSAFLAIAIPYASCFWCCQERTWLIMKYMLNTASQRKIASCNCLAVARYVTQICIIRRSYCGFHQKTSLVSIRPHGSANSGDSSTQRRTSRPGIRSFTWWSLETSSWSSSRSLEYTGSVPANL